jgi:hypothetical protein
MNHLAGTTNRETGGQMNELPWNICGGFVVSGCFETEREKLMADAVNKSVREAMHDSAMRNYDAGVADGRALYAPRTWLGRLFG